VVLGGDLEVSDSEHDSENEDEATLRGATNGSTARQKQGKRSWSFRGARGQAEGEKDDDDDPEMQQRFVNPILDESNFSEAEDEESGTDKLVAPDEALLLSLQREMDEATVAAAEAAAAAEQDGARDEDEDEDDDEDDVTEEAREARAAAAAAAAIAEETRAAALAAADETLAAARAAVERETKAFADAMAAYEQQLSERDAAEQQTRHTALSKAVTVAGDKWMHKPMTCVLKQPLRRNRRATKGKGILHKGWIQPGDNFTVIGVGMNQAYVQGGGVLRVQLEIITSKRHEGWIFPVDEEGTAMIELHDSRHFDRTALVAENRDISLVAAASDDSSEEEEEAEENGTDPTEE